MTAPAPCPICGHKGSNHRPAGDNDIWECSHLECPNRNRVTAAPSDKPPTPKD